MFYFHTDDFIGFKSVSKVIQHFFFMLYNSGKMLYNFIHIPQKINSKFQIPRTKSQKIPLNLSDQSIKRSSFEFGFLNFALGV